MKTVVRLEIVNAIIKTNTQDPGFDSWVGKIVIKLSNLDYMCYNKVINQNYIKLKHYPLARSKVTNVKRIYLKLLILC